MRLCDNKVNNPCSASVKQWGQNIIEFPPDFFLILQFNNIFNTIASGPGPIRACSKFLNFTRAELPKPSNAWYQHSKKSFYERAYKQGFLRNSFIWNDMCLSLLLKLFSQVGYSSGFLPLPACLSLGLIGTENFSSEVSLRFTDISMALADRLGVAIKSIEIIKVETWSDFWKILAPLFVNSFEIFCRPPLKQMRKSGKNDNFWKNNGANCLTWFELQNWP